MWTPEMLAAAFACAGVAYIRTTGICLILAVAVSLLAMRWRKQAFGFLVACAFLLAPWFVWAHFAGGQTYLGLLVSSDPYRPQLGSVSGWGLLLRVLQNAKAYWMLHIPVSAFPAFRLFNYALINWPITAALALMFDLLLLWWLLLCRKSLPSLYVGIYLIMLHLWPSQWADVRLLVPVVPFMMVGIVYASHDAHWRVTRWRERRTQPLPS